MLHSSCFEWPVLADSMFMRVCRALQRSFQQLAKKGRMHGGPTVCSRVLPARGGFSG